MQTAELVDYCKAHPITDIGFSYHNQHISAITLHLTNDLAIQLEAVSDCPSLCWFKLRDDMGQSCKDRVLTAIETSNQEGSNTEITLVFEDGTNYQLVMHDDSEGFYSSWVTTRRVSTV